jgi:hypothetical protein
MIRKSGYRFSLATNAERVCAEIMLKQKAPKADISRFMSTRPGLIVVGRTLVNPADYPRHINCG